MSAVSLDLTPKGSVEIETLVNGPIRPIAMLLFQTMSA